MHTQYVRDLAWVINSPSLITHHSQPDIPLLDPASVNAEHLAQFLKARWNHRVGFYFEALIEYWLVHVRGFELIDRRHRIKRDKQVIGELDFLFRDDVGLVHHWETAVKFYLHFPHENHTGSHYVGPNARDTFEKKLTRMLTHQLPMSEQLDLPIDVKVPFLKGRIFYHPEEELGSMPKHLAHKHLRATWLHQHELHKLAHLWPHANFAIQQKPHWLAEELGPVGDPQLLTPDEAYNHLVTHFKTSTYPQLLSVLEEHKETHQETTRCFIVHDNWPESAE